MKKIYADNASTTPIHPKVLAVLTDSLRDDWANPSSIHTAGREVATTLAAAREKVAQLLGAESNEIFFTSGGTEALNWAIRGTAVANSAKGKHIITQTTEHPAVLKTMTNLESEGFEVTYLDVDKHGLVTPEQVGAAIRPDTTLVAIMHANNETGTVFPIAEIAKITRAAGMPLLSDGVQTIGKLPVNMTNLGVDMYVLSAHKFHGPRGAAVLYIRRRTRLKNLIEGGGQERRRRGGTENVAAIVAMTTALEIATDNLAQVSETAKKRDYLIDQILTKIPHSTLTGSPERRLCTHASFTFDFIEGESVLLMLDALGVAASTGSACSSESLTASHVLLAMGILEENAHGSLRLSITHDTTYDELDYIVESLAKVVQRLREMSPLKASQ